MPRKGQKLADTTAHCLASQRKAADPAWRQRVSEAAARAWKNVCVVARHREAALLAWQNPKYRSRHHEAMKLAANGCGGGREVVSRMMRQRWADPKFRNRMLVLLRAAHCCPGARVKHGVAAKRMWADPEFRRRNAEMYRQPDRAARCSEVSKRMWADPENAERWIRALIKRNPTRGRWHRRYPYLDRLGRELVFKSGEQWELGFAKWLDQLGLTWWYEPDVLLLSDGRRYVPDFLVHDFPPDRERRYVELKPLHRDADKAELAKADGHKVVVLRGLAEIDAFKRALTPVEVGL